MSKFNPNQIDQLETRVAHLLTEADAQVANSPTPDKSRPLGRGDAYTVVLDLIARLKSGQDIV